MDLNFNWFKQDPIDLEHKQYVLLNYLKNVKEDFENFQLYPAFQQISLHLANSTNILENDRFIFLKNKDKEIDDEILISDLGKRTIKLKEEEKEEVYKIANFSKDKLTQYFLLGKSIWSILYDAVEIDAVENESKIKDYKTSRGFFYFDYKDEFYVYEYLLKRIKQDKPENKCHLFQLYKGDKTEVKDVIISHSTITPSINVSREEQVLFYPIFKVTFSSNEFPLEGGLLSLTRRKILNYIFQTVSMKEIEENEKTKEET